MRNDNNNINNNINNSINNRINNNITNNNNNNNFLLRRLNQHILKTKIIIITSKQNKIL